MTKLTLDQIIYYNGISYTIEDEGKKVSYSIDITYPNGGHNLIANSAILTAKQGKKTMFSITFDKLTFKREDKQNTKDKNGNGDLSIIKNLISSLEVKDLHEVDQNLFILCTLIKSYVTDDETTDTIIPIKRVDFLELIVETGKQLEMLNIVHTLEFSRMYRFALRDKDIMIKLENFKTLNDEITKLGKLEDKAKLTVKINDTDLLNLDRAILEVQLTKQVEKLSKNAK